MIIMSMPCMARVSHCIRVGADHSTQVAFALARVGGDVEATIENLEAVVACPCEVCYNELHNLILSLINFIPIQ